MALRFKLKNKCFDYIVNESIDCQSFEVFRFLWFMLQVTRLLEAYVPVSRFQSTDCFIVDFHEYASRLKIEYWSIHNCSHCVKLKFLHLILHVWQTLAWCGSLQFQLDRIFPGIQIRKEHVAFGIFLWKPDQLMKWLLRYFEPSHLQELQFAAIKIIHN